VAKKYQKLIRMTDAAFSRKLVKPIDLDKCKQISMLTSKLLRVQDVFHYRIWQARKMGFVRVSTDDLSYLCYGLAHNRVSECKNSIAYDWAYNHFKDEEMKWFSNPKFYCYYRKHGLIHWPPFQSELVGSFKVRTLNELDYNIPEKVIYRILQTKAIKLFNVYEVVEPIVPKRFPFVIAQIWELPYPLKKGKVASFFLSEWDDASAL
jgi:hypothetical protein